MGIYRFVLACCVVIEHLSGNQYTSHTGMFAVFGFYVLSGYLITRILRETYDFDPIKFWSNRALRLFPLYAIFLVIGLLLIFGTPGAAAFFPAVWQGSPRAMDWFGVFTVFPMGLSPMDWHFRPVPSIWSVGVELLNYALLFVFLARSGSAALLAAVCAAAYHGWGIWHGDDVAARYFPFYAALLPFSLGSLIYFGTGSRRKISARTAVVLCIPAPVTIIVTAISGGVQQTAWFELLFYCNLAAQCLAVWALSLMALTGYERIDKWWGDLSYPIFLCHWQVAYALTFVLPYRSLGFELMFATLAASTLVAYLACRGQDALIEPVRKGIRARALLGPSAGRGVVAERTTSELHREGLH
jgi:peptidoglycan/LPS O-acetylase OafA/YrhL